MKKIISILFVFFLGILFTYSQEVKKVTKKELIGLKRTYNWSDEKEFFIVNYRQPKNFCNYDNYENLERTKNWFEKNVFSKMDLSKCRTIFVYDDKLAAQSILDNKNHYEDVGHYFFNNYFNLRGFCYGVFVMNSKGEYLFEPGDYNHKNIELMLTQLTN